MKVAPEPKTEAPDTLHTPEETARWLSISERTLLANARARRIPVIRVNNRLLRFHWPSILAARQR